MKQRYPRTVAEFAANNRVVLLRCEQCYASHALAPDVLDATWGPDFDLYDGLLEMRAQLCCPRCGEKRPTITFHDPQDRYRSGPVSFDDSVAHQLEFNAYVRARAEEPLQEPVRAPKWRRR